jgi:hypothetical protein
VLELYVLEQPIIMLMHLCVILKCDDYYLRRYKQTPNCQTRLLALIHAWKSLQTQLWFIILTSESGFRICIRPAHAKGTSFTRQGNWSEC